MQTSDSGATSKPSSKGKNARFVDEQGEEQGTGYSHERWGLSVLVFHYGFGIFANIWLQQGLCRLHLRKLDSTLFLHQLY
jgi:hypothetical protein